MPKISVVVPIYKTRKYLERCLRTITAQTLSDIEVICIDDACPEKSYEVVEHFAEVDSRIRLIRHKKNLGLGGARNSGVSAALSPYIASVDSDDYIAPNMLERLWAATDDQSADVVAFGYTMVDADGQVINEHIPKARKLLNTENKINIFTMLRPAFWQKLWRRDLFTGNNVRFPERCYHDDFATTPRLLFHARDIRIIPDTLYTYVRRSGSETLTYSPKHIIDYFNCFDLLDGFLREHHVSQRYESLLFAAMGKHLVFHADNVLALKGSVGRRKRYLRQMLMLKIAFINHHAQLRRLNSKQLAQLLKSAVSWDDLQQQEPTE